MKKLLRTLLFSLLVLVASCGDPLSLSELLDGDINPEESQNTGFEELDVDYSIFSIVNTGGKVGGRTLSGEFNIKNNGLDDGRSDIEWEVYISLDEEIGGGDQLIKHGTTSAISSGGSSPIISFDGTWPLQILEMSYYIIVRISADDESDDSNNTNTAAVTVTVPESSSVDYSIESISHTTEAFEVNTPISQSFVIKNISTGSGSAIISWTAYISTDSSLDLNDEKTETGVETAIASGESRMVEIIESWPKSSGLYYLIISITSGDDSTLWNNSIVSDAFTVNTSELIVDYTVYDLSSKYPYLVTGSLCSETFSVRNIGASSEGTEGISWTAWASTDNTLEIETDFPVSSSAEPHLPSLDSGASIISIPINGTWPTTAGEYWLIVKIESDDDSLLENNIISKQGYTLINPPDYEVGATNITPMGETPNTTLGAEGGNFEFKISEITGSPGEQQISWEVFASVNSGYDVADHSVGSGTISALKNESSDWISFENGTWPETGSYYYLIFSIKAVDDLNNDNNIYVYPDKIPVPLRYTEVEGVDGNDDSWGNGRILNDVSHIETSVSDSVLPANELILIDGITDEDDEWDTYAFTTDINVTRIEVTLNWSTGANDLDFSIWQADNSSVWWDRTDDFVDQEPAEAPLRISGLTPGGEIYIGVKFEREKESFPYTVLLQGLE